MSNNLTSCESFVNHDGSKSDGEIEEDFDGMSEQEEENHGELDRK
jgi:hypothetical protein